MEMNTHNTDICTFSEIKKKGKEAPDTKIISSLENIDSREKQQSHG